MYHFTLQFMTKILESLFNQMLRVFGLIIRTLTSTHHTCTYTNTICKEYTLLSCNCKYIYQSVIMVLIYNTCFAIHAGFSKFHHYRKPKSSLFFSTTRPCTQTPQISLICSNRFWTTLHALL